jgi:DNA-binding NarL/FixJ family response regulator
MAREMKIVIVDDHPIVRQGLRQSIETEAGFKVVGEAGDGHAGLELIDQLKPDIAVIDVNMPGLDGFGTARAIRERQYPVETIFLTIHREEDLFKEAIALGARGYVLKDSAVTDIVSSIRAVAAGQHFTSPALTTYLVSLGTAGAKSQESSSPLESLTPTEQRILKLIAEYKTSKEIAAELYVSPRTVETHRTNISNKLNLRGSHALMKFALLHKSELL